ncbi:MAG: hypothetical protein M3R25_15220, partial [Bacteroidota bacterium]|nr:hypothetical protein [Bacteroidota bacterium]
LKRIPIQPGHNKSDVYSSMVKELVALQNVSNNFASIIDHLPLIMGDNLPEYWCKIEKDGKLNLFLAQWPSKNLAYPIYSGQSIAKESEFRNITFTYNGKTISKNLEWKPYQSLMLKITPEGEVEEVDISFVPRDPVVRPRQTQRMNF